MHLNLPFVSHAGATPCGRPRAGIFDKLRAGIGACPYGFFRIITVALMPILLLGGISCAAPTAGKAGSQTEITDQLGRVVRLDKLPQRIVSLAPSNTEILYALGLEDSVVGVTDFCNYPPQVKQKPSIGGFSTPNIEKVVAQAPDLILAASIHQKQIIPQLEGKGLTVLALAPKTIKEVEDAIVMVGKTTGKEKESSALIASMEKRAKVITDKTDKLSYAQRPRVFYVTWHDPLITAGSGTFHDELIRLAGGVNIAANLKDYPGISLEAVIQANPQIILSGVGMGEGAAAPLKFATDEIRLKGTEARINNRVYGIDMDLVGRAGPRIVDALEQFAGLIHPELFK